MNYKLAGVLGAVVIAVLVWSFARSSGGKPPATAARPGSGAKLELPTPKPEPQEPAPAGMAPRWQLDADPEGPLRLEGQVVDEDGHGVGSALVALSSVPPRTATTEGDGTFAFDKLVGREYTLSARAGDLIGGPLPFRLTATSDPVVLRVTTGATLAVTVLDETKKPVAGATVTLSSMTAGAATTDDAGIARVKPVEPGWVTVQATASGYAPTMGYQQVGAGGGSLTMTLHEGFAVSGSVVDEAGKPLAGVQVMPGSVFDMVSSLAPVTTDAKGTFALTLAVGTHTLVATDHEHAPARSIAITVDDKPVSNIEIVMLAGGELSGTVADASGKPVAFATVRVGAENQQAWQVQSRQTTSDKSGAFSFRGLARAKLRVRAESDTSASSIASADLAATRAVTDLELVLDVNGTIAGIVVDEANQPVAEVSVNPFPDILGGASPDAMTLAGMSSVMTDGGGRFTLRGLPVGAYRIRAARSSGRGMYDWGQDGVAAKTGDTNVKITLAAPGSIIGKLVLESGGAPTLATIQVGSQPPTNPAGDGTFKLTDVTPGTYDLHVRGPEFAAFTRRDVTITPGKPTDVGTLTLVRGRKLVGKVIDASGNGVAGAKVKTGDMLYSMQGADESQTAVWEEMAGMKSATTDQDGRFVVIGIAKKATNLMADHAVHGRSDAVAIPAGTDDAAPITLTLRGYGQLVGKVTSQGKPVGGATITATPKGGGSQVQIAQSEADGSFTLAKVPEGTLVVSAMEQNMMGMSLKSTSTTVQVTARKQTKVTIDIPVGSVTLAVDVKPLPDHKVDSAQIFLFRGAVAMKNAKELTDAFLGGGVAGMKFWFGAGKSLPEFEQLVAGDYSVCTIPILGDLNDSKLQQRLQEHMDALAVYCKQAKVKLSPAKQTFVHEVPTMSPIPTN